MSDLLANPPLRDYLSNVRAWHGRIRFLGLPDRRDHRDIIIDRLFVPPFLTSRHASPDEDPANWRDKAEEIFDTITSNPRLILLGDPGSGKTTLLDYLVWLLARPSENGLVDRLGWRLPVPVTLREMQLDGVHDFDGLLGVVLDHPMFKPLQDGLYLREMLATGRALIVLDGIDEIGSRKVREDLRDAILDGFNKYPDCRWLLSSRIVGYDEVPFDGRSDNPRSNVRILERSQPPSRFGPDTTATTRFIAPFDDRQIAAFARNWYVQREAAETRAGRDASNLVDAVHADDAILRLARVPNLLAMMALIHRIETTLPHGRALLYDRIAEAYLESIDKFRGLYSGAHDLAQKRLWLARIAYEMQFRRTQGANEGNAEILVEADDVIDWLSDEMNRSRVASGVISPQEFLEFVSRRSGLFVPRAEGRYAFVHLSFQEYFAAVALEREVTGINWARREITPLQIERDDLANWAELSAWREVLTFLFELIASKKDWHTDVLDCLFGRDYSRLHEGRPDEGKENLACLAARLLVNPRSGIHPSQKLAILRGCIRTQLQRQVGVAYPDHSTMVFKELLGESAQRDSQILGVIGEELNARQLSKLDLSFTPISDLCPISKLDFLESLSIAGTQISDLAPVADLDNLTQLELEASDISDIRPLAHLPALRRLNIMHTEVTNFSALANLGSLERLSLSDISDLTPLANLTGLQELDLVEAQASDLAPLSNLPDLKALSLFLTNVSDLTPLACLTNLGQLTLFEIQVSDLDPLSSLTNLEALFLYGTDVSDLTPLAKLTNLQRLYLIDTKASDLTPIANLTNLQQLNLLGTNISDLMPLANLSELAEINLMRRQVPEKQLRRLRKALPDCRINV